MDLSSLGFYSPPVSPDSDFSEDSALSHEEDLGSSLCETCGETTRPGTSHTCLAHEVEVTDPAPLKPARPVGSAVTGLSYLRKLREHLEKGGKDEAKTWNERIIENQGPSARNMNKKTVKSEPKAKKQPKKDTTKLAITGNKSEQNPETKAEPHAQQVAEKPLTGLALIRKMMKENAERAEEEKRNAKVAQKRSMEQTVALQAKKPKQQTIDVDVASGPPSVPHEEIKTDSESDTESVDSYTERATAFRKQKMFGKMNDEELETMKETRRRVFCALAITKRTRKLRCPDCLREFGSDMKSFFRHLQTRHFQFACYDKIKFDDEYFEG